MQTLPVQALPVQAGADKNRKFRPGPDGLAGNDPNLDQPPKVFYFRTLIDTHLENVIDEYQNKPGAVAQRHEPAA